MISHSEAHRRGDFIKIAEIKSGCNQGGSRPEQHTVDQATGKLHKGSDANYVKVIIPVDTRVTEDCIYCRNCDKFKIRYIESLSISEKCRRVEKIRIHESECSQDLQPA